MRKEQSNGVPENLLRSMCRYRDRSTYEDQHARIIIMSPEHCLQREAEYIDADCSFT